MSNDNKDFFDYDSYVKSNGKKKKKKNKAAAQNQKSPRFVPADKGKSTSEKKPAEKKKSTEPLIPEGKIGKLKEESKESIENIKRMFDDALDENADEMAELVQSEPVPEMPAVVNPQKTKNRLYFILGVIITILAIVGLIATVNFSIGKIKAFADNTQQKNEFAKFIYPIVICDPAPFNQTVKLRNDTMLTAAIWDIILYEDKSKYESNFDYIIVPEVDVEQHATKLFGTGLSFQHESIIGVDIQFYYEESVKSYRIPSNPKYFTYSPYIENITRVGERYTLTVGYVSPTPAWLTLTSDEAPEPEKYVDYVVSKRGNEYTLVAIQQSEMEKGSELGL